VLHFSKTMSRLATCLAAGLVFLSAARGADRWAQAEEWEDADLAIFFTGELRGYVEPCG
jgi:hypothetical protein